ncbi:hypothetical protein F4604DRAFT_1936431 [Suillus subluteus]|nr:hypothetical protein F4604DRAFT_1936431 [Suillus subluteus]
MNREPGDWVLVANYRTEADLSESQPESTTDQTNSDSLVKDDPMLSVTDVNGDSGDSGDPWDPWETSPDRHGEALASASSDSETSREKEPNPSITKAIFRSFFNTVTSALLLEEPNLTHKHNLLHKWSAADSSCPVHDLTLLDDLEARWDTIKAVCKLTVSPYLPSQTLSKTLDSKAYLLLKHQPWRHFALFISLNGYCDLCIHLYDHSGGVMSPCTNINKEPDKYFFHIKHTLHHTLKLSGSHPTKNLPSKRQDLIESAQIEEVIKSSQLEENELSLPPAVAEDMVSTPAAGDPLMCPPVIEVPKDPLNPEPVLELIGKICVDKNTYDILEIIFSTQGLIGHGSVCYLTMKDNEEYIIKDHWVLRGKKAVLNEINMMKKMEGVHGVPQLIEHWLVEVAPGEVEDMRAYRYKFPYSIQHTFHTHVEFLSAIQDIVNIQRQAVEKHKVLHHDASLNNAMIKEDDGDGSHGMLVDWEFTVDIVEGEQYVVGGTGTLPFMLQSLLFNLYLHTPDTSDECSGKRALGLRPYPVTLIKHDYKDDLESMFYVFVWTCIEYMGPLGMKHVLPKRMKENLNWITCE